MFNLQFNVISEPSLCLFSPFLPTGEKKEKKKTVAQHIKMYLNNVLLKMGQGPYVFIIFQ